MDWSHFLLPYKGRNNQIQVNSKPYMKHMITPFKGKNEAVGFVDLIFGIYFLEIDLGCYLAQPCPVPPEMQLDLIPSPTGGNDIFTVSSSSINSSTNAVHCPCTYNIWTIYFDDSKMLEGSGTSCVLIHP